MKNADVCQFVFLARNKIYFAYEIKWIRKNKKRLKKMKNFS